MSFRQGYLGFIVGAECCTCDLTSRRGFIPPCFDIYLFKKVESIQQKVARPAGRVENFEIPVGPSWLDAEYERAVSGFLPATDLLCSGFGFQMVLTRADENFVRRRTI